MPPFSGEGDNTVGAAPLLLEIESIFTVVEPVALCRRRSSSSNNSAVSPENFPIAPIPEEREVSFHPLMEVIYIEDIDDYTDEEFEACWHSEEELANVRRENRRLVQKMQYSSSSSSRTRHPEDSLRGLEQLTHSGFRRSQKIKHNSVVAVLSEQNKQRQTGRYDPALIRETYSFFADYATARAIELASGDALESLRMQQEEPYTTADAPVAARKCWLFDPSSWFPRLVKDAIVVEGSC